PRCSVPADVEKCPYAAVLAAHGHQGLAQEVQRVIVARIRDVTQMTYDLPGRGENALLFGFEEIRVAVYPARKTEAVLGRRLRGRSVRTKRTLCIHSGSPWE